MAVEKPAPRAKMASAVALRLPLARHMNLVGSGCQAAVIPRVCPGKARDADCLRLALTVCPREGATPNKVGRNEPTHGRSSGSADLRNRSWLCVIFICRTVKSAISARSSVDQNRH